MGQLPMTEPARPERPGRRRPAHREPAPRKRGGDEPVLPDVSRDETDLGWGDEPRERDDDWYRRERPPHHE
jgi:hypothetical protein